MPSLPEMHQDDIDGEPMEPGREAGLSAEGVDLAEQLQEGILGQVFGFGGIAHHAQTERIYAAAVQFIEAFERGCVTLLRESDCVRLGEHGGL